MVCTESIWRTRKTQLFCYACAWADIHLNVAWAAFNLKKPVQNRGSQRIASMVSTYSYNKSKVSKYLKQTPAPAWTTSCDFFRGSATMRFVNLIVWWEYSSQACALHKYVYDSTRQKYWFSVFTDITNLVRDKGNVSLKKYPIVIKDVDSNFGKPNN